MSEQQFLKSYLSDLSDQLKPSDETIDKLIQVRDMLLEVNNNDKKVFIFGNGGSAATASHLSADLTKNADLHFIN